MTDFRALLSNLNRPRMLIRAARFGMLDYHRDRDLKRLVQLEPGTPAEISVARLLSAEHDLEETRRAGNANYCLSRHIEVLIALLSEIRLLPRQTPA